MRKSVLTWLAWMAVGSALAEGAGDDVCPSGIVLSTEIEATGSHNQTPLWLVANRYGVGSTEDRNGYLRICAERDLRQDKEKHWGLGYAADLFLAMGDHDVLNVQQLYLKTRYRMLSLTLGQREEPAEFMNQELSSGGQTLGINARPVPGVRMGIDDYWDVPGLGGWLGIRGHIFYGIHTDGDWNEHVAKGYTTYGKEALQHTKAGYLRIGPKKWPLSVEGGLQMGAIWGGKSYNAEGELTKKESFELKQLVYALTCKERDEGGWTSMGNMLGSWLVKINYERPEFDMHLYTDIFFERRSGMFFSEREVTMTSTEGEVYSYTVNYPFKDKLLGLEMHTPSFRFLNGLVMEYIYTKYQQGPIGHESSEFIPEVLSGSNSYYNHGTHSWTHRGQVLGNALYRSPIFNSDHSLDVQNNRFVAYHMGVSGDPTPRLHYRLLMSWQRGWGTYSHPYIPIRNNTSLLAEVSYQFGNKAKGLLLKGAVAADKGEILGNNLGAQLSLKYTYGLNKKK